MTGGYNHNYGGATVYVDISHLQGTIQGMRDVLAPDRFHEVMRRTFNDAGRKVKSIVRKEVPKDYNVTASWAGDAVGWPKQQGIGVVIPIKGKRGSIGGLYSASGPRGRPRKGVKTKIYAKIVRAGRSTLPDTLPHQGGQPPFFLPGVGSRNNRIVMTRKFANKPKPIVRVVGLGVPQMPINKSREDVQDEIRKVIETRLVHHYQIMINQKVR